MVRRTIDHISVAIINALLSSLDRNLRVGMFDESMTTLMQLQICPVRVLTDPPIRNLIYLLPHRMAFASTS